MKKLYIWIITISLITATLAIAYIQFKWIGEALKLQEKQFRSLVNKILDEIIEDFEKKEIIFTQTTQIISASPDSLTAFSFTKENKFKSLLKDDYSYQFSNSKPRKYFIYQEGPSDDDIIVFDNSEFKSKIKNKGILYVAELDKQMTGRKVNITQRINPNELKNKLDSAFEANGIKLKYEFAIIDEQNKIVYSTKGFNFKSNPKETFSKTLFPHSQLNIEKYHLLLYFIREERNIFASLPTLAYSTAIFTIFLVLISLGTIILIFKQKRLSELKTQFVNNVSHELKTPIATIQLATQMLTDESLPKDPQSIKHIVDIIKKENERMRFNVEKILQTSVIERGRIKFNKKTIHANKLINKVLDSFEIQAKQKDALIIRSLKAKNDLIYVDELHFTNVLLNLLENALKYNENKPVIEVETQNDEHKLYIKVQDNGIGIPKKDQKRIFEQFYRVQSGDVHNYKSFGLGLNYVKKIVEEHNGKIKVDSTVGQGSTFTIILPLAKNKVEKENQKS